MSWPVPEFPVKRDAPGAKITLWLGLLFSVLALIFFLDFYIFKLPLTEVLIFIYLPYILFWMFCSRMGCIVMSRRESPVRAGMRPLISSVMNG